MIKIVITGEFGAKNASSKLDFDCALHGGRAGQCPTCALAQLRQSQLVLHFASLRFHEQRTAALHWLSVVTFKDDQIS